MDSNLDDLEKLLADLDGRKSIAPGNVAAASNNNMNSNRKLGAKSTINMDELDDIIDVLAEPTPKSYSNSKPAATQSPQPQRAQQQSMYNPQPAQLQPQRAQQSSVQHNNPRNTMDDIDDLLRGLNPSPAPSRPQTAAYNTPQQHGGGGGGYGSPQTAHAAHAYNTQANSNPVPLQQPTRLSMVPPNSSSKVFVAKPPSVRPVQGDDLNNLLDDLTKSAAVENKAPGSRGVCSACNRHIIGEVISALGRNYHPEHFQCGNCRNPLGTQSFFEQDGVPHCERCYQELLCARCAHCDEPILDQCTTALGRKWHRHHFICTQCLSPFPTGQFFERDNRPYCENCFQGAFAPRCAGCNQSIHGEITNALGNSWHPNCFVCQYCQKAFTGSFYEYGGKPYCDVHYHQQTGSLCSGCGKAVTGRCIDALGKKWHPEHFVCAFCMNPLTSGNYTENGNKAYCKDCHGKLFG